MRRGSDDGIRTVLPVRAAARADCNSRRFAQSDLSGPPNVVPDIRSQPADLRRQVRRIALRVDSQPRRIIRDAAALVSGYVWKKPAFFACLWIGAFVRQVAECHARAHGKQVTSSLANPSPPQAPVLPPPAS